MGCDDDSMLMEARLVGGFESEGVGSFGFSRLGLALRDVAEGWLFRLLFVAVYPVELITNCSGNRCSGAMCINCFQNATHCFTLGSPNALQQLVSYSVSFLAVRLNYVTF